MTLIKEKFLKVCKARTQEVVYSEFGRGDLSYGDFLLNVEQLSAELKKFGVSEGDCVGLYCPNGRLFIEAYFAILFLGAAPFLISWRYKNHEMTQLSNLYILKYMIIDDGGEDVVSNSFDISRSNRMRYGDKNAFICEIDDCVQSFLSPESIILTTSGTGKKIKAVSMKQNALISNALSFCSNLELNETDSTIALMPFSSAMGHTTQLLANVLFLGKIVLDDIFCHPRRSVSIIKKEGVSIISVTPYVLRLLLESVSPNTLQDLKYCVVAGAPMSEDLTKTFSEKLPNTKLVVGYGLTEAGPRVTQRVINKDWDYRNVGRPINGAKVRVLNQEGSDCQPDEVGRIYVGGEYLMEGYVESRSRLCLSSNWIDSGDLGRCNKRGFLTIVGRKKNTILRAGDNISPEEVEDCICRYGGIEDVLVYGESDDDVGERVVADLKLENDKAIELQDLIKYLRGNLASYKIPSEFKFVDEIQYSPSYKKSRSVNGE